MLERFCDTYGSSFNPLIYELYITGLKLTAKEEIEI